MIDSENISVMNIKNNNFPPEGSGGFIDIHCHCLADFDDGPSNISESILLCRALVEDNISFVVATPHQLGRFDGVNEAQAVRDAVNKLNSILNDLEIPVKVVPGGEVRADERICQFIEDDKILTLADSRRYILIELPHQVFIDIEPMIRALVSMDIYPVISHVERIPTLTKEPDILSRWIGDFAYLQITASSLSGDFGLEAERDAWDLLTSGWAHLVATDAHNVNSRRPKMKNAYELISRRLGEDLANRVCIHNPLRVLQGKDILSKSIIEESRIGL
ncbi:MAG: hypothetical protein JW787_00745 [Sedimentisphaerales bacterium]|nr:hypothetical protein [Sedimentisphaerales bacterium]